MTGENGQAGATTRLPGPNLNLVHNLNPSPVPSRNRNRAPNRSLNPSPSRGPPRNHRLDRRLPNPRYARRRNHRFSRSRVRLHSHSRSHNPGLYLRIPPRVCHRPGPPHQRSSHPRSPA